MVNSRVPQEQWVGERWVIEDIDGTHVDVAVATAHLPHLFNALAAAEPQLESVAARADAVGTLTSIERQAIDDLWGEELGHQLPAPALDWFGQRAFIDGLFAAGTDLEEGMVFLVVVDEAARSREWTTVPQFGEPGSAEAFRHWWNENPVRRETGDEDALWRYVISLYASHSRVFDFTDVAHAAIADLYEEALRTANGRTIRG